MEQENCAFGKDDRFTVQVGEFRIVNRGASAAYVRGTHAGRLWIIRAIIGGECIGSESECVW